MKTMKFKRTMLVLTLLVMTLSAVTGGTIAWFTDSVESKANVITSGNLDVELEYSKDFQNWDDIKDKSDLFSNQLWEPGHTDVVYLRISNKGTLALKYLLSMNFTETEGTNVAGETFKLSNSLKYAVVDVHAAYANRDAARSAAEGSATALAAHKSTGILTDTNETQTVALVVYMPEEVGNEANYKTGTTAPVINLGIKLEAFQKDSEVDAFGPDYDADSSGQYITTADGLILWQDPVESNDLYLYLVPEEYALDTVNVPEGVTHIGNYAFAYNNNVKTVNLPSTVISLGRGFDSSTVEKVVLNEGLTSISSRAFRRTYNLKEVVISSTVTTIADNAFQGSGIKHIVFPESVTSIGDSCFTAATVETVVIKGENVHIDHFAFRDCPSLTSVTILSDKITLGEGMIFTNSQSNNDNPNNITIYTDSQDVIDAVNANGTYKGKFELLKSLTSSEELMAAIESAQPGAVFKLDAGEFSLRFTNNTNFNVNDMTFIGKAGTELSVSSSEVWYGRVQGSGVTFENIHFTSSVGATGKATYNNCTFDDWAICASSNKEETYFNKCTINGTLNTSTDFSSGDVYVKDSTIAKAEYSGSATMYFENCTIGELISWNMSTELKNCTVTTLVDTHMTSNEIIIVE